MVLLVTMYTCSTLGQTEIRAVQPSTQDKLLNNTNTVLMDKDRKLLDCLTDSFTGNILRSGHQQLGQQLALPEPAVGLAPAVLR